MSEEYQPIPQAPRYVMNQKFVYLVEVAKNSNGVQACQMVDSLIRLAQILDPAPRQNQSFSRLIHVILMRFRYRQEIYLRYMLQEQVYLTCVNFGVMTSQARAWVREATDKFC